MNAQGTMLITFGLLAGAICSVWIQPVTVGKRISIEPWIAIFIASVVSGVLFGYLTLQAVMWLVIFGMVAYTAKNFKTGKVLHVLLLLLTGWMTLALSMHRFPGFNNPALVSNMRLTADALPFTHNANFDTTSAGLILFAIFGNPILKATDWKVVLRHSYLIVLGTLVCVLSLAAAVGYIKLDFKLVPYTAVFLVTNLLFTCVTEEAFFRGFMQEQLTQAMSRWRIGAYLAAMIAALLFGIAHAKGGPVLILLATIAGLGYGYAYLKVKRVEASIVAHFCLNAVHFVAFTYPNV